MSLNQEQSQKQKHFNYNLSKQQANILLGYIVKMKYVDRDKLMLSEESNIWELVVKGRVWEEITYVNLQSCCITERNIDIVNKEQFPHLQMLNLKIKTKQKIKDSKNQFKILKPLLLNQLTNLIQLNLKRNKIGAKGANILSKCNFPFLKGLVLKKSYIGSQGAKYLSKAQFSSLSKIDLRQTQIGFDGAETLFKNNWENVKQTDQGQLLLRIDQKRIGLIGILAISTQKWNKQKKKKILIEQQFYQQYQHWHLRKIVSNTLQKIYGDNNPLKQFQTNLFLRYDD